MSYNWEIRKIEEITLDIFSGGTPNTSKKEYWNGSIPWLSSGETRNPFILETEKKITKLGVENSSTRLAQKEDIIIASAGQGHTRGQVSFCMMDVYINQSIVALRANRKVIEPLYLFYNLKSRYNELRKISGSHSSRGSLTTKLLANLRIRVPLVLEQKKMCELLHVLNAKIILNKKMNYTIGQIAETIFKKWSDHL
jgi:type I restriction enzyme, S subunit